MEQNKKVAIRNMRKGLSVSLAISISDALDLIASGRINKARNALEDALCYADAVDPQVSGNVGINSVRGGKGFE